MNPKKDQRLIQIPEIKTEFLMDTVSELKIVKLLKELFEDLSVETTALSCVEIDQLCTYLVVNDLIHSFTWYVQDFIEECMTLHDYPSNYSTHTPSEFLNIINTLYDQLYIEGEIITTTKDRIISLYKENVDISEISRELNLSVHTVNRQLIIAKKLNQIQ